MKVLKFQFDKNRVSEWFWLAIYYFEAADCLTHDTVESRRTGLASPIIFNTRHGIELLLKSLMLANGEECVELTHDNTRLFEKVRKLLKETDDASVEHAARGLGVSSDEIRAYLSALTWKVEQICKRYTEYTFLPFKVEDPKNELFRYPGNLEGNLTIDLSGETDCLAGNDTAKDVRDLSKFSLSILVMFSKSESGQHMLERMAEQEALQG